MSDEKRLRELAEAATPGPWRECASEILIGDHWWRPLAHAHYRNEDNAAYIAALSPDVTLALLDRIASLSKEVESLNAECATIAANTREARIVIQQVAEAVGCDWQGDVAAAVREKVERLRGESPGLLRAQASMANRRASRLAETIAAWLEQHADDVGVAGPALREAADQIRVNWSKESLDADDSSARAETTRLKQALGEAERALRAALATWCPRDPGGDGADSDTWRLVTGALTTTKEHGHNGE